MARESVWILKYLSRLVLNWLPLLMLYLWSRWCGPGFGRRPLSLENLGRMVSIKSSRFRHSVLMYWLRRLLWLLRLLRLLRRLCRLGRALQYLRGLRISTRHSPLLILALDSQLRVWRLSWIKQLCVGWKLMHIYSEMMRRYRLRQNATSCWGI